MFVNSPTPTTYPVNYAHSAGCNVFPGSSSRHSSFNRNRPNSSGRYYSGHSIRNDPASLSRWVGE